MLGAPSSPVAPSPQLQQQQQQPSAFPNGSEIVSTYIPGASTSTDTVRRGGSVLGSLMRMEYQRQQAARTASTRQRPKPTKRRTQPKLKPKQQRDLTFEEDKIIVSRNTKRRGCPVLTLLRYCIYRNTRRMGRNRSTTCLNTAKVPKPSNDRNGQKWRQARAG
jgi:hypothetical protein